MLLKYAHTLLGRRQTPGNVRLSEAETFTPTERMKAEVCFKPAETPQSPNDSTKQVQRGSDHMMEREDTAA